MSCFHGYSLHIPEFVLSYHLHLLVRSLTGVLMSPEFVLSHPMHLLVRSLTGVLLSPEFVLSHPMHLLVRSLTGLRHDHMINLAICIFHFDASERAEERF